MSVLCIVCEVYRDEGKRVIYETMKELLGVVVLKMCSALFLLFFFSSFFFLLSSFQASSVSI